MKLGRITTAALLLSAALVMMPAQSFADKKADQPAAKKGPAPKTQAEYEAYKAAASQVEPAKLEQAATDFAQKFPASELRSLLFQQAMGAYQQANDPAKALEMARATIKYDPNNAVALLTASQLLAERTKDSDLDRDDRLAEAKADAQKALLNVGAITQPPNLTPEQFAAALSQLRGTAHEVIATVAFKKLDYAEAIKEYTAASEEEKEKTEAVVWLRLAVSHDKSGDYPSASEAVQKAIAASQPGSQVRQLADQERARLDKLAPDMIK